MNLVVLVRSARVKEPSGFDQRWRIMAFLSPSLGACVAPRAESVTGKEGRRAGLRRSSFAPVRARRVGLCVSLPSVPRVRAVVASVGPPPNVLISGAPASGKGTQCELIVERYGVVHLSTGDMLRAAVKAGTALGIQAKTFMDAGTLVPDQLVISMLVERITQPDCVEKGWLLDGFPRTAVQACALEDAGINPSAVVILDVQDESLVERIVGRRSDPDTGKIYHVKFSPATDPAVIARLTHRSDDTEEKARVRLEGYYKHAKAVEDHYTAVLCHVDGNRGKLEVFADIAALVDTSIAYRDNDEGGNGIHTSSTSAAQSDGASAPSTSTKGIPVAEFVRRAEEAYEKGILENEDVNWSGQASMDSPELAGTSSYGDLGRRLDLVTGDIVSLLTFAYIGRVSHGNAALDIGLFNTALPFIVTWLAVSPLLGAYTRASTANVSRTIQSLARSWAIAVPMGLGLRGKLQPRCR